MEKNEKLPVVFMAGGRGTRMENPMKFLLELGGKTIFDRLFESVTPIAGETWVSCSNGSFTAIEKGFRNFSNARFIIGKGESYVNDMSDAIRSVRKIPVLLIPADTVILDSEPLSHFITENKEKRSGIVELLQDGSLTGITLYCSMPDSLEELPYESVDTHPGWLININAKEDYEKAKDLIGKAMGSSPG